MTIPSKISNELKKIIASKSTNKWQELGDFISKTIQENPNIHEEGDTLIKDLADATCDLLLQELAIIPRRQSVSAGFASIARRMSMTSAPKPSEKKAEFLNNFKSIINSRRASGDTNFTEFSNTLIGYMLIRCCNNRAWQQAAEILRNFSSPEILNNSELLKITLAPDDDDLLSAISFINLLGVRGTSGSARSYPVSEFKEVLPGNNPEVQVFLNNLEEMQTKIELGHAWSVDTSRDIRLGGSTAHFQHSVITSLLKYIQEKNKTEQTTFINSRVSGLPDSVLQEILERSSTQIMNMDIAKTDIKKLHNKNFLATPDQSLIYIAGILPEGRMLENHALAFAFWRDLFCVLDRGGDINDRSGIRIFRITDELRDHLFELALKRSFGSILETELESAQLLTYIPMKKQVANNCAWVATKGSYWLSVYVNTLQLISEGKLQADNPHEFAAQLASACYKYLSNQYRILSADRYLSLAPSKQDIDTLSEVVVKIKRPTWEARGMTPLLPLFSQEAHANSDVAIIKEFKLAIQTLQVKKTAELAKMAIATGKLDTENHFQVAVAIAAELINEPQEKFKSILDILNILIDNNITNMKIDNKYLCAEHYFEAFMETRREINIANKSAIAEFFKKTDLPTTGTLAYLIMGGESERVEKLSTLMTGDNNESLFGFPMELAIKTALLKINEPEEAFNASIGIINTLIKANIISAHKKLTDVVEGELQEMPPEITQAPEFNARKQMVLESIQVSQSRRLSAN